MPQPTSTARLPLRGRIASVVRRGDAWRVLVYRAGGGNGGAPGAVERTQSVPLADVSGLAAALARAKPSAIVRVVPPERIVVRMVNAPPPAGDAVQVAGALTLAAEAQLGGSFSAHRRGAMLLPGSSGTGTAIAALGWSGEGTGEPAPDPFDDERMRKIAPCVCVPAPAALVAIAAAAKAAWGLLIDRGAGVVASCGLSDAEGRKAVLRVARDDPDDAAAWGAFVSAQAGLAAGPDGASFTHADGASFVLAPGASFAPALQATTEPAWLADFGLALGAVVCAASPSPAWHGACAMLPVPPVPYRPWVVRAADVLAPSRRAGPLLAACAALLLLGPWGLAWARHTLLKAHIAASGEDDAESIAAQKQAEHYQLLKDRRWPMTKLLADLTGAMPAGITLETLTLEYGQNVRVTGAADSPNLVSDWRAALDKSQVFAEVRAPSVEASRFELTARVAQPFGANSVLVARPTTATGGAAAPSPAPATRATGPAGGGGSGSRGAPGTSPANGAGAAQPAAATPAKPTIPPPLTDAAIEAMDLATATREFGSRKGAAGKPGVSEADKQRLTAEAEKLQAKRKALQGSGGGGA